MKSSDLGRPSSEVGQVSALSPDYSAGGRGFSPWSELRWLWLHKHFLPGLGVWMSQFTT